MSLKITFATQLVFFQLFLATIVSLFARFQLASCALGKRWCTHQPVNVNRNCLERYLICGWLYRSQHDKFKKQTWVRVKVIFLNFLETYNQIKINKAGVKLQTYVILQILCNFDKTYMKMSTYENSVFPYSLHSTVNLSAWRPKGKGYFNVFSRSIH